MSYRSGMFSNELANLWVQRSLAVACSPAPSILQSETLNGCLHACSLYIARISFFLRKLVGNLHPIMKLVKIICSIINHELLTYYIDNYIGFLFFYMKNIFFLLVFFYFYSFSSFIGFLICLFNFFVVYK